MELLLESALQSIIFRHYSTTLASYIWTFLALFAAALSFRRLGFRGSGSRSESASQSPEPVPAAAAPSAPAIVTVDCGESSTKGRFTAYFFEEEEMDGGDEAEEWVRDGFRSGMDGLDCLDWGWKGDLGWYGYQDRTAINGCVVRLWESGRTGFEAAVRERWI